METPCTGTKTCHTCREEKHVLAFAANRNNGDGLHYECRECANARSRYNEAVRRERSKEYEF